MASIVPIILVAVPCVFVAWLLWFMRDSFKSRASSDVRRVVMPPPRHFNKVKKECAPVGHGDSTHTMQTGDVVMDFVVGNRYYNSSKNRVFECIALKGKKARFAAFGCIDRVEEETQFIKENPELGWFNKVRIDGGVETCQRGALRADRIATEIEVAGEYEFLRHIHKCMDERRPSCIAEVSVTVGNKTYKSG